jgi:hypothetical protein
MMFRGNPRCTREKGLAPLGNPSMFRASFKL